MLGLIPDLNIAQSGWVNLLDPIASSFSLNVGLCNWWLTLPTISGGRYWYDLRGSNHGTLINLTTTTIGWKGFTHLGGSGSLLFDRLINNYVDCGTNAVLGSALSGSFTISVWAFLASDTSAFIVGGNTTNSRVLAYNWITSPDLLYFGEENVNRGTAFAFPYATYGNRWVHLTAVHSSGFTTIYANGSSIGTNAFVFSAADPGRWVMGGSGGANSNKIINGYIDDVRIYNRPLNSYEVKSLYDESVAGYPNALNYNLISIPLGAEATVSTLADPGFHGLLDFLGLPVGIGDAVVDTAVPAGYHGLLDFLGLPVGAGTPVSTPTGGTYAAGKRIIRYYIQEQMRRRGVLDDLVENSAVEALVTRVSNQWAEYQYELARHRDNTILAALLSEV